MPYKRNAISGLIQYGILTIFTLALIVLFPKIKGDNDFGVFVTLSIIGNLTIFTNLGLNHALIRFLAQQGKTKESQADIIVNIVLLLLIGLIVTTGCLLAEDWFFQFNKLQSLADTYEISIFYRSLAISNFILLVGQSFASMLDAAHKIYLSNRAQIFYAIAYNGGIIAVLYLSGSFYWMGVAALIAALGWFIYMAIMAINEWGFPQFQFLWTDGKKSFQKQLHFGSKIFASSAINFFYEPVTKILIAHYFGKAQVGVFELAMKVRGQLWGIIYKLIYPSFPLFSQEETEGNHINMVRKSQVIIMFCIIPVISLLWMTMPYLISTITTENQDIKVLSICSMSAAYLLFSAVLIPTNFYLNAKGKPEVMVLAQLANVSLNFLVIYLLKDSMGYLSAVLANILSILGSYVVILYYQKKYLGLGGVLTLSQAIRWLFILLLTASPLLLNFINSARIVLLLIEVPLATVLWLGGSYVFMPELVNMLPLKSKKPIV